MIAIVTLLGVTVAHGFEGANFWLNLKDQWLLREAGKEVVEPKQEFGVDPHLLEEKQKAETAYNLIHDEVVHILPVFVGALEGVGAGATFNEKELLEICKDVEPKLRHTESCKHAAKVASGMRKEAVWQLRERRIEHQREQLKKLNALREQKAEVKTAAVQPDSRGESQETDTTTSIF